MIGGKAASAADKAMAGLRRGSKEEAEEAVATAASATSTKKAEVSTTPR